MDLKHLKAKQKKAADKHAAESAALQVPAHARPPHLRRRRVRATATHGHPRPPHRDASRLCCHTPSRFVASLLDAPRHTHTHTHTHTAGAGGRHGALAGRHPCRAGGRAGGCCCARGSRGRAGGPAGQHQGRGGGLPPGAEQGACLLLFVVPCAACCAWCVRGTGGSIHAFLAAAGTPL
jgi:hypothetical protein